MGVWSGEENLAVWFIRPAHSMCVSWTSQIARSSDPAPFGSNVNPDAAFLDHCYQSSNWVDWLIWIFRVNLDGTIKKWDQGGGCGGHGGAVHACYSVPSSGIGHGRVISPQKAPGHAFLAGASRFPRHSQTSGACAASIKQLRCRPLACTTTGSTQRGRDQCLISLGRSRGAAACRLICDNLEYNSPRTGATMDRPAASTAQIVGLPVRRRLTSWGCSDRDLVARFCRSSFDDRPQAEACPSAIRGLGAQGGRQPIESLPA